MEFLMGQSPFVVDVIFVGLILVFALIKAKIGLFHSIASLLILILSIGAGFAGSNLFLAKVSGAAWEKVSPAVEAKIQSLEFNKLLDASGLSIGDSLGDSVDVFLQSQIEGAAMVRAELLTQRICSIALFLLCFLLALFFLNLLRKLIGDITEGTFLDGLNHLGGFVLGLAEAVILLMVLVRGAGLLHVDFFHQLSEGTHVLAFLEGGQIAQSLEAIKNLNLEDLKSIDFSNFNMNHFMK